MIRTLKLLAVLTVLLSVNQAYPEADNAEPTNGKYTIESIDFDSGGQKRAYKDKKLKKILGFDVGDDMTWAENGKGNLEKFYLEKGFPFSRVSMKTEPAPEAKGKLKLTYVIDEGPKVSIRNVLFSGNDSIKKDALGNALKTTGRKWVLWPKHYYAEKVDEDVKKLKSIYWEKGFLANEVSYHLSPDFSDPAVVQQHRQRKKSSVDITFDIKEGPVYNVGTIVLRFIDKEGQNLEEIVLKAAEASKEQRRTNYKTFDEKQLRAQVQLEPAQVYSERTAKADARRLRQMYGENGFIYARARLLNPVYIPGTHTVNIVFEVLEERRYRIGRIDITGNKEAKDIVIRRMLDEYDFFPGNIYNGHLAPIEGGGELEKKVQRMTLAEAISIAPMGKAFGAEDANLLGHDVEVNIKEGLTGNILPGVGVSSDHGFIGQLIYDERNFDISDWPENAGELLPGRSFRGAGQTFRIGAEPGTEVSQYTVNFGDPYWGGEPNRPIRLGVLGSSWERDRESYDEDRLKGYIGFERRIDRGRWRRSIGFRYEQVEVDGIHIDAPREISDVQGRNLLAGLKLGIERNLTDDDFNPSTGSVFDASYEQVSGDYTFGIIKGTQRWYSTLHEDLAERKTVLAIKLLAATTVSNAPPFEKFYGGGTGTYGIRGFDYRGVSTRGINPITLERDDPIGSDWIFLANTEVTVPLVSESLAALFFVDSGTVDSGNYRASIGTGIQIMIPQWFGPVPMRFELAVPMMKDGDDDTQVFSFSVGRLF